MMALFFLETWFLNLGFESDMHLLSENEKETLQMKKLFAKTFR